MSTENNGTSIKTSWVLNLMTALIGAMAITAVGWLKSAIDVTDAHADHAYEYAQTTRNEADKNGYRIDEQQAAIVSLEQQLTAMQSRLDQDERKEYELEYALHTLSDAVGRLADSKRFR